METGERVKRFAALRIVGPELPKEWGAEEEQLIDSWHHEEDMGVSLSIRRRGYLGSRESIYTVLEPRRCDQRLDNP